MQGGPIQDDGGGAGRGLSRRRLLRTGGLLGAWALVLAACRGKDNGPLTTLDATIALTPDGSLGAAPGEPYTVRTDLAQAQSGRESRRRSFLAFHHLTDFRIVDEESPLRSEWVESCPTPVSTSAFRPQESLSLQAADALISQANRIDSSPVTGRQVDFALHTGNAAENAQHNELRWFMDLMDGKTVSPDSGSPGYQGVQQESPADAYPDLLQAAQGTFTAEGLKRPWYSVIGNRDVLVQGNFPPTQGIGSIAVGHEKIISLGPQAQSELCKDPQSLLGQDASQKVLSDPESVVETVSPDADRRPLTKKDWISEHLRSGTGPGPEGHGFTRANVDTESAYYVLDLGPIALIVIDTVNPGGFSAGSMDAVQFAWLEDQLKRRSSTYFEKGAGRVTTGKPDSLIVIASHHGTEAMTNPFPGADGSLRVRGVDLEALLHRFPNVVLHVAGHSGANRIVARPGTTGGVTTGYWQVSTASPLDYPMQGRLIEIADNGDGTIAVFATTYDNAAPLAPGDAEDPTPADGVNQRQLASVARLVAAHDPQRSRDAIGLGPSDRNAELLLTAPFDLSALTPPPRHSPTAGEPRMSRRALLGLPSG